MPCLSELQFWDEEKVIEMRMQLEDCLRSINIVERQIAARREHAEPEPAGELPSIRDCAQPRPKVRVQPTTHRGASKVQVIKKDAETRPKVPKINVASPVDRPETRPKVPKIDVASPGHQEGCRDTPKGPRDRPAHLRKLPRGGKNRDYFASKFKVTNNFIGWGVREGKRPLTNPKRRA